MNKKTLYIILGVIAVLVIIVLIYKYYISKKEIATVTPVINPPVLSENQFVNFNPPPQTNLNTNQRVSTNTTKYTTNQLRQIAIKNKINPNLIPDNPTNGLTICFGGNEYAWLSNGDGTGGGWALGGNNCIGLGFYVTSA